jgi:hypothetical protein
MFEKFLASYKKAEDAFETPASSISIRTQGQRIASSQQPIAANRDPPSAPALLNRIDRRLAR